MLFRSRHWGGAGKPQEQPCSPRPARACQSHWLPSSLSSQIPWEFACSSEPGEGATAELTRINVPPAPCAAMGHPWVSWNGLLGLWYPGMFPGEMMLSWAWGRHWGMLVCLYFGQTPLCVMIYCAVPEWWLTHQGPFLGTSMFMHPTAHRPARPALTGLFAKALQLVLQFVWFHESQAGLPSWLCWSCEG